MRSSYRQEDVEILLKDITGLVTPLPAATREVNIQRGMNYCEMLPLEYEPSEKYLEAYHIALRNYAEATAGAVETLAELLYAKKGERLVIVSLARAGIPVGILLKRYLAKKYRIEIKHYAISIIRGRGIDKNAMNYILRQHAPADIQFIDGWIGKGAIFSQLQQALLDYPGVEGTLGVLSDPANLTELCGTHEDLLIPSSCLNATVTGLISRSFLRDDVIGPNDFHGAAYYENLEGADLSAQFLQCIEDRFNYESRIAVPAGKNNPLGITVVEEVARQYGIDDINLIKPGIGEATRVLLRRLPWKVIINQKYAAAEELNHIYQLAEEKGVSCEISLVSLGNYKVCGIIKNLSDI